MSAEIWSVIPKIRGAGRSLQRTFADEIGVTFVDARKEGAGAMLNAVTTAPLRRAAELLYYRLCSANRGYGRPISKRAWDYEYGLGRWARLDELEELPANMVIVGYVRRLRTPATVLDVGCGSGALASLLKLIPNLSYTGIDVSDIAIAQAMARGLEDAEFFQGAMEDWTPAIRYNAIVFSECLYYTHAPLAAALRYSGWLLPGGAVIISMWRADNHERIWESLQSAFAVVAQSSITVGSVTRDVKVLRRT